MSSAVDIQIVSTPNLEKIESFFKDASYRETIEYSANFNTRLCIERRLRLPFFDPQTGVAQNHSQLFMDKRQRMPGFRQGQIYTYPAARWRKSRRQYLNKMYRFPDRPFQSLRKEHEAMVASHATSATLTIGTSSPTVGGGIPTGIGLGVGVGMLGLYDPELNGSLLEESSSLGAAGGDTSDSKDSQQQQQLTQQSQQQPSQQQQLQLQTPQQQHQQQQHLKEDLPKEWLFYDDADINDVDSLEEPKSPADDEYDYDPRYGSKKRRKRRPSKRASLASGEGGSATGGSSRRRSGAGRGRTPAAAADTSMSALDGTLEGDVTATPTSSVGAGGGGGRRPRGTGTRGRRRTKAANANTCDPPSPGLTSEPPSFESAAAAVGVVVGVNDMAVVDEHGDLRNYRKYL